VCTLLNSFIKHLPCLTHSEAYFVELKQKNHCYYYGIQFRDECQRNHTILPIPGDPTKMTLSTEDTSASPVSANLVRKALLAIDAYVTETKGKNEG